MDDSRCEQMQCNILPAGVTVVAVKQTVETVFLSVIHWLFFLPQAGRRHTQIVFTGFRKSVPSNWTHPGFHCSPQRQTLTSDL